MGNNVASYNDSKHGVNSNETTLYDVDNMGESEVQFYVTALSVKTTI